MIGVCVGGLAVMDGVVVILSERFLVLERPPIESRFETGPSLRQHDRGHMPWLACRMRASGPPPLDLPQASLPAAQLAGSASTRSQFC